MKARLSEKVILNILPLLIFLVPATALLAQQSSDAGIDRIPEWPDWKGKIAQLDQRLLAHRQSLVTGLSMTYCRNKECNEYV